MTDVVYTSKHKDIRPTIVLMDKNGEIRARGTFVSSAKQPDDFIRLESGDSGVIRLESGGLPLGRYYIGVDAARPTFFLFKERGDN